MKGNRNSKTSCFWAVSGLVLQIYFLLLGLTGSAYAEHPPQPVSTIESFFQAIDDDRDGDAINMMSTPE